MTLTRRDFLKRSGILALAGIPAFSAPDATIWTPTEFFGRALTLTPIYDRPDLSSQTSGRLLPDETTPITSLNGWYQVPTGYIPREAIQPVEPFTEQKSDFSQAWAEVISPSSAIREWCAAMAPISAKIGFGAVIYVTDHLIDDRGVVWYGVTDTPNNALIGWLESPQVKLITLSDAKSSLSINDLSFQFAAGKLLIFYKGQVIGETPYYGPELPPLRLTQIVAMTPGATMDGHFGVPWMMRLSLEGHLLTFYGSYWHNLYGKINPSPNIELPISAARWLYSLVAAIST